MLSVAATRMDPAGYSVFPPVVYYATPGAAAIGRSNNAYAYIGHALDALAAAASLLSGTYGDGSTDDATGTAAGAQIGYAKGWAHGARSQFADTFCICPTVFPRNRYDGDRASVLATLDALINNDVQFDLDPQGHVVGATLRGALGSARDTVGGDSAIFADGACQYESANGVPPAGWGSGGTGGGSGGGEIIPG